MAGGTASVPPGQGVPGIDAQSVASIRSSGRDGTVNRNMGVMRQGSSIWIEERTSDKMGLARGQWYVSVSREVLGVSG